MSRTMMSTSLKGQAAGSAVSGGFVANPQRSACKHICGLALAQRMQVGVTKDVGCAASRVLRSKAQRPIDTFVSDALS